MRPSAFTVSKEQRSDGAPLQSVQACKRTRALLRCAAGFPAASICESRDMGIPWRSRGARIEAARLASGGGILVGEVERVLRVSGFAARVERALRVYCLTAEKTLLTGETIIPGARSQAILQATRSARQTASPSLSVTRERETERQRARARARAAIPILTKLSLRSFALAWARARMAI